MKSVCSSFVVPWQDFEVALNGDQYWALQASLPGTGARLPNQFCILECLTALYFEDRIVLLKMGFRITSPDYFEGHKDSCL